MIFDFHAHYDAEAFNDDRDEVLRAMPAAGVGGIVNCGTTVKSSEFSLVLTEQHPFVWAATGIHPEDAAGVAEADIQAIGEYYSHPKCVALGEIGLDYHWLDLCDKETQLKWFERQLRLAKELDAPVIVHDREAHEDTFRLLKKYRPRGVLHCYSGSAEMLREVAALDMYIGLGGAVTFKNAVKPMEAAKTIPLNRLLLETDAPYMAPEPFRGERCDSRHIRYTAEKIAAVRGMEMEELLDITAENARELFNKLKIDN